MRPELIPEYNAIRDEVRATHVCITDYVNKFFAAVATGIAGAYYLSGAVAPAHRGDHNAPLPDAPSPLVLAYICLIISYGFLAFAGVLFHKFNTHNRYAGYARTLARENWDGVPYFTPMEEVHIWESVLEPLDPLWMSELDGLAKPSISTSIWKNAVKKVLTPSKNATCHRHSVPPRIPRKIPSEILDSYERTRRISKGFGSYLRPQIAIFTVIGFFMVIRIPWRKVRTSSWTYPYNIAFAVIMPPLFLIGTWSYLAYSVTVPYRELFPNNLSQFLSYLWPGNFKSLWQTIIFQWKLCINLLALTHVLIGWMAMCLRMYRLCGADGDRTIDYYSTEFQVRRWLALALRDIRVSYIADAG
jgi:hypothetical protein